MAGSGDALDAFGEATRRSTRRRAVAAVGAGLALAFVTTFLGLMLSGAGHGWTSPFFFSMPLVVLYPAAFLLATGRCAFTRPSGVALVGLGLLLDLALAVMTVGESEYFFRMMEQDGAPEVASAWVLLWLVWQAAAFVAAVRGDDHSA